MKKLALAVIAIFAGGCDMDRPTSYEVGTVVGKSHTPASSSSTVGFSTKGDPVFGSSSTPERYSIIVQKATGEIESFEVKAQEWVAFKDGDNVTIEHSGWSTRLHPPQPRN
jgi:uncharacterized protein YaiE (UPF0345 family)